MEQQRERTRKIEQFMSNTGTDRSEALDILNRNKWSLECSYQEIERLCITEAQNKAKRTMANDSPNISTSHRPCGAIDMGRGAAVNLDKRSQPPSALGNQLPRFSDLNNDKFAVPSGPPVRLQYTNTLRETNSRPGSHVSANTGGYIVDRSQTKVDNSIGSQPLVAIDSQPLVSLDSQPLVTNSQDQEEDVFDENQSLPPTKYNYPRLKRGFSNILENESLVSEARHSVQQDIEKDSHDHMYIQTFVLPNLTIYQEDFRIFLEKELIETSTLVSLEQAGRLNWWSELRLCQRLLPMATSGDGNCLLHAASLAMWGIHDRQLILRKELHDTLTKADYKDALYRRWRYQQTVANRESGLVFNETEWKEEWENILRLASPRPRGALDQSRSNNCCNSSLTQGSQDESVVYESLEEFHVFVLAHVLQRPIIVVADSILRDSDGEALAPIPFPGVYLPIEVRQCFHSPLLLTYDAAHFSALCPMEQNSNIGEKLAASIPLVDPDMKLLPLHFYLDPGKHVKWDVNLSLASNLEDKINLLQKFMDVERMYVKYSHQNGDSDQNSWGSQDSEDLVSKDKRKDDKKKDAKMAQQMQSVAKQFGSIGKTMGKKLKQFGKSGKQEKSPRGLPPLSVSDFPVEPAKVISPVGSNHNVVLVANLSEKQSPNYSEMVDNYLKDAKERFLLDREIRKKNDIELRNKVSVSTSACVAPGCNAYGTAENSYLCSSCYAAQRREQNMQHRAASQFSYNTFPGRVRQTGMASQMPPTEIFRYGNSKFYTASDEDVSVKPANSSVRPATMNNSDSPRLPSPSPDYDNLTSDYHPPVSRFSDANCKTENCNFFGRAEWSGLCSKCWNDSRSQTLLRHSTKL